jgi:hypothetical protein
MNAIFTMHAMANTSILPSTKQADSAAFVQIQPFSQGNRQKRVSTTHDYCE